MGLNDKTVAELQNFKTIPGFIKKSLPLHFHETVKIISRGYWLVSNGWLDCHSLRNIGILSTE